MNNPVSFSYVVGQNGQVNGQFALNQQSITFKMEKSANPLHEMLTGMMELVAEPRYYWGMPNTCKIDWYDESESLRWILSTQDGQQLDVLLYKCANMFEEPSDELIISGTCSLINFYQAILEKADLVIKENGLLGYGHQQRQGDFPIASFLFLKKFLINQGKWFANNQVQKEFEEEINLLLS